MQSPHRTVAALAFALAAWCVAQSNACLAGPFDSASGVFVSVAMRESASTLTIQQGDRLMVFSLSSAAAARERSGDEAWRTVLLTQLASGEPVTLQLDPAGYVTAVDAEYATITTRLLVERDGYLVTTSGQAYHLVGAAAQVQPRLDLGTFLRLRVDPATNTAFDVTASSQPFAGGPLAQPIAVTFVVTVPLNTPTRDIVYMATDVANWVPNGVRLSPITGNRWTVTLTLGKGSSMKYKFTRGSWGWRSPTTASPSPRPTTRRRSMPSSSAGPTCRPKERSWTR